MKCRVLIFVRGLAGVGLGQDSYPSSPYSTSSPKISAYLPAAAGTGAPSAVNRRKGPAPQPIPKDFSWASPIADGADPEELSRLVTRIKKPKPTYAYMTPTAEQLADQKRMDAVERSMSLLVTPLKPTRLAAKVAAAMKAPEDPAAEEPAVEEPATEKKAAVEPPAVLTPASPPVAEGRSFFQLLMNAFAPISHATQSIRASFQAPGPGPEHKAAANPTSPTAEAAVANAAAPQMALPARRVSFATESSNVTMQEASEPVRVRVEKADKVPVAKPVPRPAAPTASRATSVSRTLHNPQSADPSRPPPIRHTPAPLSQDDVQPAPEQPRADSKVLSTGAISTAHSAFPTPAAPAVQRTTRQQNISSTTKVLSGAAATVRRTVLPGAALSTPPAATPAAVPPPTTLLVASQVQQSKVRSIYQYQYPAEPFASL